MMESKYRLLITFAFMFSNGLCAMDDAEVGRLAAAIIPSDLTSRNSEGESLLHIFVRRRNITIVRALLEAGADALAKDIVLKTPLDIAVEIGFHPGIHELLKKAVGARDRFGVTHLHLSVVEGRTDTARELLKAGADVNAQCENGSTSLDIAYRQRVERKEHPSTEMEALLNWIGGKEYPSAEMEGLLKKYGARHGRDLAQELEGRE